ncbi:hypothetical protein F2P81_019606 [Scophthalmus maximus]|uniref:Uncharacterized protein n=1 Tax=Scophthalmus maximus TaxID=52904 RepID=A0A6A4S7K4_SCOMX|nr:hypothetical protein F2P81_019606 [Scophthalmus maximus]
MVCVRHTTPLHESDTRKCVGGGEKRDVDDDVKTYDEVERPHRCHGSRGGGNEVAPTARFVHYHTSSSTFRLRGSSVRYGTVLLSSGNTPFMTLLLLSFNIGIISAKIAIASHTTETFSDSQGLARTWVSGGQREAGTKRREWKKKKEREDEERLCERGEEIGRSRVESTLKFDSELILTLKLALAAGNLCHFESFAARHVLMDGINDGYLNARVNDGGLGDMTSLD